MRFCSVSVTADTADILYLYKYRYMTDRHIVSIRYVYSLFQIGNVMISPLLLNRYLLINNIMNKKRFIGNNRLTAVIEFHYCRLLLLTEIVFVSNLLPI